MTHRIDVGPLYTCSEGFKWPTQDPQDWDGVADLLRWRRRNLPSMTKWLKAAAYREPVARFLLRYGQHLKASALQSYVEEASGHCYDFSYGMMRSHMDNNGVSRFTYMIGLGLSPHQPPQFHAWNVVAGEVLDRTWLNPHAVKYCGIEIGQDLISFLSVTQSQFTLGLFSDFETMWPYLENYCLQRERLRRKTKVGA